MRVLFETVRRDVKLFFKDKGMFFTSLITPLILLVLYATFLSGVYKDSFVSSFPEGITVPDKLLDGTVAAQMISALLSVCCVTVAFCSNLLMIGDRANGCIRDFSVSPVKSSLTSVAYFVSSAAATLIISYTALGVCFIYLAVKGWYLSALDIIYTVIDVLLLVLFGTALSSCVNFFLTTSGQASAVGTIVSAGYGFVCGAYMPTSSFPETLQTVLKFLPGTYGTVLLRNRIMNGYFEELKNIGFTNEVLTAIRDGIDCNLYINGSGVSLGAMAGILVGSTVLFTAIFIAFNVFSKRKSA